MKFCAIVAVENSGGIGIKNSLPWKISEDMTMFREKTIGNGNNAIIMGRKTHESIGMLLGKRENIIITRNKTYKSPIQKMSTNNVNPVIFNNVEDCLNYTKEKEFDTVWVIGGEEIYSLFLSQVDDIYITQVIKDIDCDAYFPIQWVEENYSLVNATRKIVADQKEQKLCEIVFKQYSRK